MSWVWYLNTQNANESDTNMKRWQLNMSHKQNRDHDRPLRQLREIENLEEEEKEKLKAIELIDPAPGAGSSRRG